MAISPIRYTVVAFTTGSQVPQLDQDDKPVQNGFDDAGGPVYLMTDPLPSCDERAVHNALIEAVHGVPGARIVQVGSGLGTRNPLPPVPDTHHPHVAKLREAGHHEAADHLEHVGALHADMHAERVAAADAMVKALPHDGFVPGRPVHEDVSDLTAEVKMRREHAGKHRKMHKALRGAASMHAVKAILASANLPNEDD